MKNLLFILGLICLGTTGVQAQSIGSHKIKKANKLVWFGLDFSEVQCVGRSGFTNPDDIANRVVHAWNDLFITEHDKYNLHDALKKDDFYYDLSSVEMQNEKVSADDLIVSSAKPINRETIEGILTNYSSEKYPSGLGAVFIVEELNKTEVMGKVHVVLFDIETKDVVKAVKYETEPGGFGFRNYWARVFYEVIDQIEDEYKKWYKKNK